MPHLLIIGLGYSGRAVARAALAAGCTVSATSRTPAAVRPEPGVALHDFAAAPIAAATHLLVTAAPDAAGDPVLAAHGPALTASGLAWIGYLSTTGVYGARAGAVVAEDAPPAAGGARARRRGAAAQGWARLADRRAVDLCRVAGIYGPGRSALDEVRAGRARRILRPGHVFSRIHRDDIAGAVLAAMGQARPPGARVLHYADREPAEPAAVVTEAARLLGAPMPPAVPFEIAFAAMGEMARSFWAENRRVSSAATEAALGRPWRYPSYREGLAAILTAEREPGEGGV